MNSADILEHLESFATLLELNDANPFKIRAYTNGIRAIESSGQSLGELIESGQLTEIKGIGKGLAAHILALHKDEPDPEYAELKAKTPDGLLEMLRIPGLGAKKVKAIYESLGIASLGELEYACHENRLAGMKGFGAKSQANVLKGIEFLKERQGLHLYPFAAEKAQALLEALKAHAGIQQLEIAGSIRRRKEIIKDIDLIASCQESEREQIMQFFGQLAMVSEVLVQGPSKTTVSLKSGMQADLRLVSPQEFPHLLQHMTGSKEHNTALRGLAKERGLKVNEYGLFEGDTPLYCQDEAEIYQRLGLSYIPPELRENQGELELAARNQLPGLISAKDILGVFHAHSVWSDGEASVAEMAKHCRQLGYQYLGISEHSQSAVYAHGLEVERVRAQWQEIDRLNAEFADFRIFKGIEVDILPDGQLDYEDELLAGFDFVIASVHSRFKMSREEMTERILAAARHPKVTMLGHLTGRLLLARDAYPLDIEEIIRVCAENGTIIELNAHPSRLDLDWRWGPYARKQGLKISINPDAHSLNGFDVMDYGIAAARKGGFRPQDVLNTLGREELESWLRENGKLKMEN